MTDTNDVTQENAVTPPASSTEQKTPEVTEIENVVASKPTQERFTPEEAAWNELKGTTQERIKQILRERDDLRQKTVTQAQLDAQRVTPAKPTANQDEIREAANILRDQGKLASQDDLNALMFQIRMDEKHERLADKYSGSGGMPKYDRTEVEDYMKRKSIWDPEAAFHDMYFDEFTDAKRIAKKSGVYTEKPIAGQGKEEPLSAETLREKLTGPKGREFYESLAKDPEKFDELLRQLSE